MADERIRVVLASASERVSLIGAGRMDDPVRTQDGKCSVRGCSEFGRTIRVTNPGYAVLYCYAHEVEAARMFDHV